MSTSDGRTQAACLRFASILLGLCLFLQRFGLPFGAQSVSVVGPLGLALAGWGLATGSLMFDRRRVALFLGVMAAALLGAAWHTLQPTPFDADPSTQSLLQFVALTGFATLAFAVPVDEAAFFTRVNQLLAIIAVLGIVQFAAQFAGLRLFSFSGLVPDSLLIESGYNLEIPVGIGNVLKSNGLVLIEPSVFSQFMAVGLMVEVLTTRRVRNLALFAAGLLLSFSGTGWMVLASFLVVAGLRLGGRGVALALGVAAVLTVASGAMLLIAPDFAAALGARLGEVSQPGTSGHMRFVTPFWMVGDVLARAPSALLAGIGGGMSERLTLPYAYDVNTPIKVFIDYGAPLLVAYLGLFWSARRTALQGALFLPCMLLFLFTGGYQQFPPVLFPVLLLVAVARLRPSPLLARQGQ